MTEALRTSLDLYHLETLKQIAETLDVSPTKVALRKETLVATLSEKIRAIAGLPAFIERLSQAERAVLALMLKKDGIYTLRDITLPLIMADMIYVEGLEATLDRPRLRDVILSLMRKGLVVNLNELTVGSRRTFEPLDKFGIAPEVRAVLPRALLPLPEPKLDRQATVAPAHIKSTDTVLCLRRLFFVWAELRREPADLLKSGEMSKRDLRRIAKSLGLDAESDIEHLAWLQRVLQALKLLEVTPTSIMAVDNDAVKLFWNASPRTQLFDILKSYPDITFHTPVDINILSQFIYYTNLATCSFAEIRRQVLGLLKEIAQTSWFPFPLFVAFLNGGRNGSLLLPNHTLQSLYAGLRWLPINRRDMLDKALQQLDHQTAVVILKELQALGVVELGYAAPDGVPIALRLTPLACAHFTNQPATPSAEETGQVILQPDFQILAMGPVPLSVMSNLERFAEREKFNESVVSYRITREAVYQALQRGESSETIRVFLEEATGQPVPQNIIRTLEEWGGQYERIVIRRDVVILQVDDAALLDKLLRHPQLHNLLHRLDERVAWLHTKHRGKVEAELEALGALPTYSQGPEADLPNSLYWDQDSLRSRQALPSLYVDGTLRRIAEASDDGWRLTPHSVHLAVSTGLDIPDIIALVERMTGTPLTPEWRKQLKAWGKHYGSGQVARVLLLRLESDETLQELRRADRRLSRWLRPLPQAPGLAVIDEKHWEEMQTLLTEFGVDVKHEPWW
ncbi:MAG TPA: helicase-associated domain-containing protein [Anaerolineae bacterium]|nr:helicase-associated domain-containing protein [Anaerolineae bacterium]HQK14499.1 helicase-associated domain-containing protein [Anaerolineae bacterium]